MTGFALGLALGLGLGCAKRAMLGDVEVRQVRFDGNRGFLNDRSDSNLRQVMTHPVPGFHPWPFRRRVALDRGRLLADRQRVQTALAHRGFFDADVDWRLETRREATEGRPTVVDVVGEVVLGSPYKVTEVQLLGLEGRRRALQRRVRRTATGVGAPFLLATHEANRVLVRRTLQNLGFPDPTVTGEVRVRTSSREVTLVYTVDSGARATLRDIRLDGLVDVPADAVRRRLRLSPGQRFDRSASSEPEAACTPWTCSRSCPSNPCRRRSPGK
ncbi:MAG: POTRA domain-containing protein, partial [Myxococcota bacterium]